MTLTAQDIFGTDESAPERRLLRAGPLSVLMEAGQLRDVRWHGIEVIRGIAYLLRDASWGTLPVQLTEMSVSQGVDGFTVKYTGRSSSASGNLTFRAAIDGQAHGALSFEVEATAESDFMTNRIGFVLLHADDAAGLPLRVGHSNGAIETTAFPLHISPDQPAFDILSLEHEPTPGVSALVEFSGGVWEMEDQRNWSDASFKTYVRPLAWPRPYVISAGTVDRQKVTLRLSGQPRTAVLAGRLRSAHHPDKVPPFYLRLAEHLPVPQALPLPKIARGLILRVHGDRPDAARLAAAQTLAEREGLTLSIEAIFPQRDPQSEVAACLRSLAGLRIEALLIAGARDFKTRASGTIPSGEASLEVTLAALRQGFSGRIGTGTPAFFTEFNRNPPPAADMAFFGINPIVHAADDVSVMETLLTYSAIMQSAAAFLPSVGLWPGPVAIAPTINPYGPDLVRTDGRTRTCLAERDPRHGALFGAAHLLAAVSGVLPWAEAIAPLNVNGPTGLVDEEGTPYPLAFVHAELARAEGCAVISVPSAPGISAVGWRNEDTSTIVAANIGPEPTELSVSSETTSVHLLAPGSRGWEAVQPNGRLLRIDPYRTVRLKAGVMRG